MPSVRAIRCIRCWIAGHVECASLDILLSHRPWTVFTVQAFTVSNQLAVGLLEQRATHIVTNIFIWHFTSVSSRHSNGWCMWMREFKWLMKREMCLEIIGFWFCHSRTAPASTRTQYTQKRNSSLLPVACWQLPLRLLLPSAHELQHTKPQLCEQWMFVRLISIDSWFWCGDTAFTCDTAPAHQHHFNQRKSFLVNGKNTMIYIFYSSGAGTMATNAGLPDTKQLRKSN